MTLRHAMCPFLFLLLVASAHDVRAENDVESEAVPQFEEILGAWVSDSTGRDTAAADFLQYVRAHYRLRGATPRTREARILRRLAAGNPESYIPMIGLYTRTHLLAIQGENLTAAAYLRMEASRLIEEYMATVRSPQGWRLGSRFYVSLAASLRETLDSSTALHYFEEALDAEPNNAPALFAAAALREKYGQYSSAAQLLQRLLALAPIPEAELRLALCQARSRKLKQAAESLENLTRNSAAPDWIRSIAYQEWSQLRMKQGDPDTALRIAREGHDLMPQDESLAVLLAFMSGPRDPVSHTLSARLTSEPTGTDVTARGLYNLWPPGVARNEEVLAHEMEIRMPLMAAALQAAGEATE